MVDLMARVKRTVSTCSVTFAGTHTNFYLHHTERILCNVNGVLDLMNMINLMKIQMITFD